MSHTFTYKKTLSWHLLWINYCELWHLVFNQRHAFVTFCRGLHCVCSLYFLYKSCAAFILGLQSLMCDRKVMASQSLASLSQNPDFCLCCLQPSLWCSICVHCTCSVPGDFAYYFSWPVSACFARYSQPAYSKHKSNETSPVIFNELWYCVYPFCVLLVLM